jgi:hypothetical protein
MLTGKLTDGKDCGIGDGSMVCWCGSVIGVGSTIFCNWLLLYRQITGQIQRHLCA